MLKGKKDKDPGGEPVFGQSSAAADDPSVAGKSLRLTIHDVAKLAGVSVGTVSRVLNGFDNVLPETKMRVQEAIDRLGYTPNVVARSLRQQQSRTIGLVVPDFESPFFGELIDVIESEAAKVGYGLIVGASRESAASEQNSLSRTGIAAGRGFAVRGVEHGHQATDAARRADRRGRPLHARYRLDRQQ